MKPQVTLVGENGNAFAVLGKCVAAAKKAKWTEDQMKEFSKKAMSGDYDNLLQTCLEYFDVN
jgi:hypothetical protein